MSAAQDSSRVLDQLQAEVNWVLEQTGRLFAAVNGGSKSGPAAQATKLKRELPRSISRFHESLDQLEDELQLAKAVMRRDLALCREEAGEQIPAEVIATTADNPKNAPSQELGDQELGDVKESVASPGRTSPDAAVAMQEPEPVEPETTDAQPQGNDVRDPDGNRPAEIPDHDQESPPDQPSDAKVTENDSKPPVSALQVDTSRDPQKAEDGTKDQADDEKPPDTGTFSNNADLESLFNDPGSAGPGEAPDFGIDSNVSTGFDFETFNANLDNNNNVADNDNISALLPGLQDYANTQPSGSGGEPDFSALFATDAPATGDVLAEGSGDGQGSGEQRDSTFDDLMDFADFNANDYAGDGEGGSNGNQDYEFIFD